MIFQFKKVKLPIIRLNLKFKIIFMKRVFIIHGWGGYPEEAWFPWLKQQLKFKGINVEVPLMPKTDQPQIDTWVNHLAELIDQPDKQTYLVGHSIGVQTILRYLETINQPIGGVLAVAGFYTLIPDCLEGPEEGTIAKPWLETPINNEKVRINAGRIRAIFSDNDPCVGLENVELFKQRLAATTLVLKNKGHMGTEAGFKQIPEISNELMKIIGN